jgi:hypothetical protein
MLTLFFSNNPNSLQEEWKGAKGKSLKEGGSEI